MAAENGFKINGEIYEVPTLDSLNLDERYILYDYTTLAAEDFAAEEGESEDETIARVTPLLKHPGWWPALQHIAYRRKHKDEMSDTRMKKLILAANSDLGASAEILSTLGEPPKDGEGEDPPSTSELDESSPPNSDGSSESSGSDSATSSEGQVVQLATTTTPESPTPSAAPQASSAS